MSQWARNNPDEMAGIAALSLSEQNAALRHAIDHDRHREEVEEWERDWEEEDTESAA